MKEFVSKTQSAPPESAPLALDGQPVYIYTDGSNFLDKKASWAIIVVQSDKVIDQKSGVLTGEICSLRNIAGELKAAVEAIDWARKNNVTVTVCHDLEAISRWGNGEWKTNNKWTRSYKKFVDSNRQFIAGFYKILAHSGVKWNEMADELAGKTLKNG